MANAICGTDPIFQIPQPTLENSKYYAEGAYGVVFFDYKQKIATKIFKRNPQKTEVHIRKVMNAEVSAYQKIANNPELSAITPKFYGAVKFSKIIENRLGKPSAKELIADCAYQMEFVQGAFKDCHLPISIENQFRSAGVNYVGDVAVKTDDDGKIVCVIDFATHDYSDEL